MSLQYNFAAKHPLGKSIKHFLLCRHVKNNLSEVQNAKTAFDEDHEKLSITKTKRLLYPLLQ
jgi:hypothetical protein